MGAGSQIYPLIVNWDMVKDLSETEEVPFDPWGDYDLSTANEYDVASDYLKNHFLYWDGYKDSQYHHNSWFIDFTSIYYEYLRYLLDITNKKRIINIMCAISPDFNNYFVDEPADFLRYGNGLIPPASVQYIYNEFRYIDKNMIEDYLTSYSFMHIESKHEELWDDDEFCSNFGILLKENITSKEELLNAIKLSEIFFYEEEIYQINSIEKFLEYFDFYYNLFEVAATRNAAVYITSYYN